MNRRRALMLMAAGAGVATLAACGAPMADSDPPAASTPAPATAAPTTSGTSAPSTRPSSEPGVTLASMGISHGPAGVTVPGGLSPRRTIDQPNVVTLILSPSDGQTVQTHLEATLPTAGFTIEARSDDSLVFSNSEWTGAWTRSPELAGLTFRRRA